MKDRQTIYVSFHSDIWILVWQTDMQTTDGKITTRFTPNIGIIVRQTDRWIPIISPLIMGLGKSYTTLWLTSPKTHTVKSTARRMSTPVLISFSTWIHTIFSCIWTVLLFLTWLYTGFWLYMMQKHPFCEIHSISLQTSPVIRCATMCDRQSLTYESRMIILSSTLNWIGSRRFISEKICVEVDI